MTVDLNQAGPQKSFDVVPAGTVATLRLTVRKGQTGDGGWLRRSKDGQSEALDCEFVVLEGEFAKHKFWGLFTLSGTSEGHAEAARISHARLRAILESARGINPDDKSETARKARQVASYSDFDGMIFVGKIGVEPAKNGYPAKNTLLEAITPDRRDWHPVEQAPKAATGATATKPVSAPAIERPVWAR